MTILGTAVGWLTEKRLRAHATILGLCLWLFYAWLISNPGLRDRSGNLKGTDFLHFYTIGTLAAEHRGDALYDMNAQAILAAQDVPAARGIRYFPLYPPQVSLLFAPLSALPYGSALLLWWTFGAGIYAACCYAVWGICPNLQNHGGTVMLAAMAYPAFFHLIAWGQTSAIALGLFTVALLCLESRLEFAAGLALGCLVFKPQLGLAAAVVFVAAGLWKVVAGGVLASAAQAAVGILYYGIAPFRQWMTSLAHARQTWAWLEPRPYQTHSLRTFWSMLVPWPTVALALYVISAIAVLAWTILCWRTSGSLQVKYSTLLLATVLVAPHLTVYDLLILAPALLLLADWALDHSARGVGVLLYLIYLLPLLGPYARWTHLQLSVIAMAACLYLLLQVTLSNANAQARPHPAV